MERLLGPHGRAQRVRKPYVLDEPGKASAEFIEDVVTYLQQDDTPAMGLWDELEALSRQLAQGLGAEQWACSMELCTQTLGRSGEVRVHCHLFLWKGEGKMYMHGPGRAQLRGSVPHKVQNMEQMRCRQRRASAGLCYLLMPKLGLIMSVGSQEAHSDFEVSGQWVMRAVAQGKMTHDDARREFMRIGKGIARFLQDLKVQQELQKQFELDIVVQERRWNERQGQHRFKRIEAVEDWKRENFRKFDPPPRKTLLVLDGPSRTGKTQFSLALWGVGRCLQINCCTMGDTPTLHGFDWKKHDCILWDECSPSLVCNNRLLFQHPVAPVDVGHSPTGQHVVRHFLNNCVSIACSNRWASDLMHLSHEQGAWLEANTVVIRVDEPLWEVRPVLPV